MNPDRYRELLNQYETAYGFRFIVCNEIGQICHGEQFKTDCSCRGTTNSQRIEAARQTLSFGEPIIGLCCENGFAQWAVPLMHNSKMSGALVVQGIDLESGDKNLSRRLRKRDPKGGRSTSCS